MSHFYATIEGNRGEATRCGTQSSGITTTCQSYEGSIIVTMRVENGKNWFEIQVDEGSATHGRVILEGKVETLASKEFHSLIGAAAQLQLLARGGPTK